MELSRRHALAGASLGLTLPVLAACSSDDDPESATDPHTSDAPTRKPQKGGKTSAAPNGIAEAGDVPVGSGIVLADQKLVLTQPSQGEFKCFTAVCTHQGCLVDQVTDTINCPCHGSMYSIEDGSVVGGPAPSPLAEQQIAVDGGSITLA